MIVVVVMVVMKVVVAEEVEFETSFSGVVEVNVWVV